MLSFLIKKTFFDMWDNLLAMFLINTGFVILVCGFFILPSQFGFPAVVLPFYIVAGVMVMNFYAGAVYRFTLDISDYKKGGLPQFLRYLVQSWKESLISSLLTVVLLAVALYALPYYLYADSPVFLIAGALTFWVWFTVFLATLFFFPTSFRLKKRVFKNLRSCFFFVFGNTPFSFFSLFIALVTLALSAITFFLIIGPATVILWINVCYKIRLYKYEYLEAHPGANKKHIPWDELIALDQTKVGKRTLRGMIFPWK
jgi:hypothetical protein